MKKNILILILVLLNGAVFANSRNNVWKINQIKKIRDLDSLSVFHFAIMSDNKGDSPTSKKAFSRMNNWIKNADDKFVIGLGDHVKKNWKNDFIPFIKNNKWWKQNFYPGIADGENEFYGNGQGDWGAGKKLFDETNFYDKKNVFFRKNKCEYYAKIKQGEWTIHLIQIHFPDEPKDLKIAFPEDSKEYLIKTLKSIKKGKKDIIIVGAHSRTGSWIEDLTSERQKIVLEKADLVLSATTHFFKRIIPENSSENSALCINTGSITYPFGYCPKGYVEVHVMDNPKAIVVQYINANREKRELENYDFSLIKYLDGKVSHLRFRPKRDNENYDKIFGELPKKYSKEELENSLTNFAKKKFNTQFVYIKPQSDLTKKVSLKNIWEVFPYNNNLVSIFLQSDEYEKLFGKSNLNVKSLHLIISDYSASYVLRRLGLKKDRIEDLKINQHKFLKEWMKNK
jgi:predicted phosphodiesterase